MSGDRAQFRALVGRLAIVAIGAQACLVLVACGGGGNDEAVAEATPQATVTVTEEAEPVVEPEPAPEATIELPVPEDEFTAIESPTEATADAQPATISEAELRAIMLSLDDLKRAGTFPKGPFSEQVQTQPGAQSYATFDTVQPPKCAGFVQGPFAGTVPDPGGPITGSASVLFLEGEVASVPGQPVSIIETVQVFASADAASQAFTTIVANAPECRSNSYDDGGGVIERAWLDVFVTMGGDNPTYQDTVAMFDDSSLRAIGLVDASLWGLSLVSSRALDAEEIDRFEDLMQLSKSRLQGGLG